MPPRRTRKTEIGGIPTTSGEVQLVRKGGEVMGSGPLYILLILSHQLALQGLGQAIPCARPRLPSTKFAIVAGYDFSMSTLLLGEAERNLAGFLGQRQLQIRRARGLDFFIA